jgi:hypothetical protein
MVEAAVPAYALVLAYRYTDFVGTEFLRDACDLAAEYGWIE